MVGWSGFFTEDGQCEWEPRTSAGNACGPVCATLLLEARDMSDPDDIAYVRWCFKRRIAEVAGRIFEEPPPESAIAKQVRRDALVRFGVDLSKPPDPERGAA
jgi:hypothetical protein